MYQARFGGTLTCMSMSAQKPGWYAATDGPYLREWDGYRWTGQTMPYPQQQRWPQQQVVVDQPRRSVTKERRHTSHTFHLIMTWCTFGLWGIFVWLPLGLWHKFGPRKKVVTHYR